MPYTVNVNVSDAIVTATDFVSSITITETDQTFTITNAVSNFTVTNNVNYITFDADGGYGFDFITKNIGDWSTGTTYSRNDIVRYDYSLYIANTSSTATFVSTLPPPQEPNRWETFWTTDWTFPQLKATLGTFTNLTAGGTVFPVTSGTYGTVLTSNGSGTAYWSSLGELVIWDLSDDLRTNGFNIVTGSSQNDPNPQLTIASGGKDQGNNTSTFKSFIKLNAVPVASTIGTISSKGLWTHYGDFTTTNKAYFYGSETFATNFKTNDLRVVNVATIGNAEFNDIYVRFGTNTQLQGGTGAGYIKVSKGFQFPDGTVIDSTAGFIGTGTGTISIQGGRGIGIQQLTSATVVNLNTATTSEIGGVKIASSNASFAVNAATGVITLNTATTSRLGGVKPGSGIDISEDGTISVSTSATGITNIDSTNGGITVNDGPTTTLTLNPATASILGGIKIGTGLSIDVNGVVTVNTATLTSGKVSLTEDMLTNGYKIKYNAGSGINVLVDSTSSGIYHTTTSSVKVDSSQAEVIADNIRLRSRLQTIVGFDIYNSELQVSKIYNFSGTGPPFFPQGVQYPDNTVQVTAFQADNGIIPAAP